METDVLNIPTPVMMTLPLSSQLAYYWPTTDLVHGKRIEIEI